MRVWFTRPDLWDCISKGIGRCTVWLEPPVYDATPVGTADPLYPHNPIGWTVPRTDANAGEGRWQLSARVDSLLKDYPDLATQLFEGLSRSIDGQGKRAGMYDEWTKLLDNDFEDNGQRVFVLEMDVPPALWWRLARQSSCDALALANRMQSQFSSELPF